MPLKLVSLSLIILISTSTCQRLTDVERAQILKAHLEVREDVQPSASNMLLMHYSMALERLAADWAARCVLAHPNPRRYPQYRGIGQNIALIAGFKPYLTESVCGWKRESRFYRYSNNTCSHKCGHYIQLVWAKSSQLGCARQRCDGLNPGWRNPQYLTVCQYRPGVTFSGVRPYLSGASCSRCPEGYSCYHKQCVRHHQPSRTHPTEHLKVVDNVFVPECLPDSFYSISLFA
ncbi:GLIPR1-like protein 1 [Taenia crassiceps]|uniref:GLIPR1-like protein 1 n=1 Tax=Taenia crassiceps TaxID=6207 RepID=A0ABR4Q0R3_9CEST